MAKSQQYSLREENSNREPGTAARGAAPPPPPLRSGSQPLTAGSSTGSMSISGLDMGEKGGRRGRYYMEPTRSEGKEARLG